MKNTQDKGEVPEQLAANFISECIMWLCRFDKETLTDVCFTFPLGLFAKTDSSLEHIAYSFHITQTHRAINLKINYPFIA